MQEREATRARARSQTRPRPPLPRQGKGGNPPNEPPENVLGRRGFLWGLAAIVGIGGVGARVFSGSHSLPEPQGQVAGPEYRAATLATQPAPSKSPPFGNASWTACPDGRAGRSASGMDLVLAIDTTGSMGSVLGDVKAKVGQLLASLRKPGAAVRVGIVIYRDYHDAYIVRSLPLTSLDDPRGVAELNTFIGAMQAGGGGDWPEAMSSALEAATSMEWRGDVPATVVVIADAPAHAGEQEKANSIAQNFREKVSEAQVSLIDTGSGGDSFMRHLPKAGGGRYVTYDGNILNSLFPAISGC